MHRCRAGENLDKHASTFGIDHYAFTLFRLSLDFNRAIQPLWSLGWLDPDGHRQWYLTGRLHQHLHHGLLLGHCNVHVSWLWRYNRRDQSWIHFSDDRRNGGYVLLWIHDRHFVNSDFEFWIYQFIDGNSGEFGLKSHETGQGTQG